MTHGLVVGITSVLLVLALELTGCGAQGATSHPSLTAPVSSAPACPESPPGGTLPSPLPAPGNELKLPAEPCFARYEGVADVRGLATLNLTIGRVAPGEPYFAPTLLKGTAGESLQLHIVNTTPTLHNISIPSEGIDVDIPAGGAVDVRVNFPTHAPIVYVCKYHDFEEQAGELYAVSG